MDDKQPAKKQAAEAKTEFSGHISSISTVGSGALLRFDVVGKKGQSRSFQLDAGNAAVVTLVTAAYVAGKKVTVMDAAASEIRLGAKPKMPKVPKLKVEKPPKRVKGPVIEKPPMA
jgi:hypothetical protein